jgi:pimeloyl-ACP methyl ester carboxylesterase
MNRALDARMPGGRFARRAAWSVAAVTLLLAVAWFAASWFFSSLVAQPAWRRPDPVAHAQAVESLRRSAGGEAFEVQTADGLTLRGLHLPAAPANDRFVVMLHGYGGNLLEYESQHGFWRDLGFDVFVFDQRGSGASDGAFLSAGLLESSDLGAVIAAARRRMPAGARGGVYGRSGGGATAVMYAGQGGAADFVVVDCAFDSFPAQLLDRLRAEHGYLPAPLHRPLLATTLELVDWRFGIDLALAEPRRHVAGIRAPVLFVTTAADDYIRPAMTQALHAGATARSACASSPWADMAPRCRRSPRPIARKSSASCVISWRSTDAHRLPLTPVAASGRQRARARSASTSQPLRPTTIRQDGPSPCVSRSGVCPTASWSC